MNTPARYCTCDETLIANGVTMRRMPLTFEPFAHRCGYVDARNAFIAQAEAHACKLHPGGNQQTDDDALKSAWTRAFSEKMDELAAHLTGMEAMR